MDDDNNLDIFKCQQGVFELTKELVQKELLIFQHYQVDVKEIKCSFPWWENHETMFLTIRVLACQILGIVGSQIQTERIFSLVGNLINLRRCHLQLKNLEKLINVNKNWPNDYKVSYKMIIKLVVSPLLIF